MSGAVDGVFEERLEADVIFLRPRQQHGAAGRRDALEELDQLVHLFHDVGNYVHRITRHLQLFTHIADGILRTSNEWKSRLIRGSVKLRKKTPQFRNVNLRALWFLRLIHVHQTVLLQFADLGFHLF